MKKNSNIKLNNKNWRLLDATLNHREIARGNWKKKESALNLIRSGRLVHNKKSVVKPYSIVSKGLRYRINKQVPSLSLKRKFIDSNLKFKFIGTKVGSVFWSNWTDQVVSSMGKEFSFERGRFYGTYKEKILTQGALRNFYRIKNKYIKSMRKSKKNLPMTPGYRDVLYKNLERRLDVSLVRLGYAPDLIKARQLIKKGSVKIDNRVVKYAHELLEAGNSVSVIFPTLPFSLIKREHLKHFPVTWRNVIRRRSKKSRKWGNHRRTSFSWFYLLGKNKNLSELKTRDTLMKGIHDEGDFRKVDSRYLNPKRVWSLGGKKKLRESVSRKKFMLTKYLQQKLKSKSRMFKKKILKRSFKMPVLDLSNNFTYVGVNKALFTHYHTKNIISVPGNLAVGKL